MAVVLVEGEDQLAELVHAANTTAAGVANSTSPAELGGPTGSASNSRPRVVLTLLAVAVVVVVLSTLT